MLYYNLLIPKSFTALCIAHWQVHHQEFSKLSQKLGQQEQPPVATLSAKQRQQLYKTAVTVRKLGKVFGFKCLAQAVAAQRLLKRKKITTQLYLGVNKNENALKAHAWLKHGDYFITGEKGSHHFATVITYHSIVK